MEPEEVGWRDYFALIPPPPLPGIQMWELTRPPPPDGVGVVGGFTKITHPPPSPNNLPFKYQRVILCQGGTVLCTV